ncbi:MAG: hypothetical protein DMF84_15520 [Acidobacteria bacterium]|nr:MAG: hypothetical protein DMF84_15520 [Acidobacteriota bacterium]
MLPRFCGPISGNKISNVFDAGIEGVNAVTNTTIADNTITNAIIAGISSYHCTAWQGNTMSGNRVSQSLSVMKAYVSIDVNCFSYPNPPSVGFFKDNVIANNVLRNALGDSTFGLSLLFNARASSAAGNLLQGNDVGGSGIELQPISGFSDGGGNSCGPQGNFKC